MFLSTYFLAPPLPMSSFKKLNLESSLSISREEIERIERVGNLGKK